MTAITGRATDTPAAPGQRAAARALVLPAVVAFVLARAFDVAVAAVVSRRPSTMWSPGDLGAALSSWDGQWYRRIATTGYPAVLSRAPDGTLRHNALAFFPGYPGAVAGLRAVTGVGFVPAGLAVALIAGAVAAGLLPVLLAPYTGRATAVRAGVLWACSPVSAVLTLTYSDGLFTAEAVLFLLAVTRRRLGWLWLVVPAAAATRGVLVPLAVVLGVHLWGRRAELVRPVQRVGAVLAVAAVVAASAAWPVAVAVRTGQWDAYLRVQQSWQHHLVPVLPWAAAVLRLGVFGPSTGQRDIVVLVAFVSAALAILVYRRGLPPELTVYAPAMLLYLFLILPATPSFLRFTVPVLTLAIPAAAWLRGRLPMAVALVGCALAQLWWLQSHLPYLPDHHVTP